jgi:predicted 3-demethylubiquinone-9 3-methyltransferase (glyoxalase superfamily)
VDSNLDGLQAKGNAMAKNTICLWYDKDAEAAAHFYAETFPDSTVGAIHRAPSDALRPAMSFTR